MAGIYIHVPFCKKRCIYCDFYSTTQSNRINEYVSALCKELEMRKEYLHDQEIKTIYFGGGTPSQLNREHFEKWIPFYPFYRNVSQEGVALYAA